MRKTAIQYIDRTVCVIRLSTNQIFNPIITKYSIYRYILDYVQVCVFFWKLEMYVNIIIGYIGDVLKKAINQRNGVTPFKCY